MTRQLLVLCLPAFVAACAASAPPAPAIPDSLQPRGASLVTVVAARGTQVYECRAKKEGAGVEWAFVAPEAELFDAQGANVGKHYAGPHWEARDGSKLVGAVAARADAPRAGAIPWLLLTTKSVGPAGAFSRATHIQRVNTAGGIAPATGCGADTVGKTVRVAYSADYRLLAD
jgi:hypothetical protein